MKKLQTMFVMGNSMLSYDSPPDPYGVSTAGYIFVNPDRKWPASARAIRNNDVVVCVVDFDAKKTWMVTGFFDAAQLSIERLPENVYSVSAYTFENDDTLLVIKDEDFESLDLADAKKHFHVLAGKFIEGKGSAHQKGNWPDMNKHGLSALRLNEPVNVLLWPGSTVPGVAEPLAAEHKKFLARHKRTVQSGAGQEIDVDAALEKRSGPALDITYVDLMSQNINYPHVWLQPLNDLTVLEFCLQFFYRHERQMAGKLNAPKTTRIRYVPNDRVWKVRAAADQYGNHTATANKYLGVRPDEVVLYDINDRPLVALLQRAKDIMQAHSPLSADSETEKRMKAREVFYRIKELDTTKKLADKDVTGKELFIAEVVLTGRPQEGIDWGEVGVDLLFEVIEGALG